MNTRILLMAVMLAAAGGSQAQTKDGGISLQMLRQVENAQQTTAADKALFNAIAANSIDDLARNHAVQGDFDTHFGIETPRQSIHNQKSSGRCWMFSGLNVLRADYALRHEGKQTVEFSQGYLFFYDQLEKANLMLQGVIDCAKKPMDDTRVQFFFHHPINDGGTFCGVADLAEKYGLVPMSAQPETFSGENTTRMQRVLSSKLREYGLELRSMVAAGRPKQAVQARKTEMLATVYRMLCLTLGAPVKEFSYAFRDSSGRIVVPERKYTPREFYEQTVGRPLNGSFIMVMNDPRRPFYKTFEVEYDRHTYDGHNWKYLNLPMEDIARLAISSLKAGRKLYSSYDVGKQFDRKRGYMDSQMYDYGTLFGTTFGMDKAQRIATYDSGSTHAMTLTAVDLDASGRPLKWKVENSWGPSAGLNGYAVMTNQWFNDYMFRLVVSKEFVPETMLRQYEQKPVMVMPEDPLFQADR